jgi:hypothetical protein
VIAVDASQDDACWTVTLLIFLGDEMICRLKIFNVVFLNIVYARSTALVEWDLDIFMDPSLHVLAI